MSTTSLLSAEPAPLGIVLGRVQGEIEAVAAMSMRIQDAISGLLGRATLGADDVHHIQQLDLVSQHLASLDAFLRELGGQIPGDWTVVPGLAAGCVTLSNLAHRLVGAGAAAAVDDDAEFF